MSQNNSRSSINLAKLPIPALGFAAFSGSGKTTLLCQVIPLLRQQGLRLGLIKHSHHAFEVDRAGKDSYLLHRAGACQVVVASHNRTVVITDHSALAPADPLGLADFLARISQSHQSALDLILIEGYKHAEIPKIEVYRPALGQPLLALSDEHIIAVACDTAPEQIPVQPLLGLNNPSQISEFICTYFQFYRLC